MDLTRAITLFIIQCNFFVSIYGHARLLSPPSRASKWRFGFSMPAADYDDNQGYCGGRSRLWNEFGGKCGVCGDAFYPIPRPHERGGRFYTGEITKEFKQGEIVEADVEVTANHRGFFEFKICPYDDPAADDVERGQDGKFIEVTQTCLDKHPIPMADGSGYKYELPSPWRRGIHTVKLRLPYNLVCEKCLFQWKYNTGNSWGKSNNGSDCMGCGHQEQFYSCADVKINALAHMGPNPPQSQTPKIPQTTWAWDRTGPPAFWTRVPGVPGWRQNPAFTTTTTTTTTTTPSPTTSRSKLWPWWFFHKDGGWFNRDELTPSTNPPTDDPSDAWDQWTSRPQTTRMPFWNRWFVDETTSASPRNAPLVPGPEKTKKRTLGFWENLFSRVRKNFWTWFFKGRHPSMRKTTGRRNRPKATRRTTTTTTPMPSTTSPWWKWWESNRYKTTTTPAPKYRSWWDSYPWARVWDKTSQKTQARGRSRPRWQPKATTTTTTSTTWRRPTTTINDHWQHEGHNNHEDNNDYNNNNNRHHNNMANEEEEDFTEQSSEVAQTSFGCYPIGIWTTLPGMKQWCVINCAAGFCPTGYCSEGCKD